MRILNKSPIGTYASSCCYVGQPCPRMCLYSAEMFAETELVHFVVMFRKVTIRLA
jgi:hypothetical protein